MGCYAFLVDPDAGSISEVLNLCYPNHYSFYTSLPSPEGDPKFFLCCYSEPPYYRSPVYCDQWYSICFIVSKHTPTTINSDVPPMKMDCGKLAILPKKNGKMAIVIRNKAPANVNRFNVRVMNTSVFLPGRIPGHSSITGASYTWKGWEEGGS